MKQLYLKFLAIALVAISFDVVAQGDPHFSQYMNNPLDLNPANAGLFQGRFRGIVNYRRQWENIGNAFQTINASADFQLARDVFKNDIFGVGLNVMQDQAGSSSLRNLNANLSLSYTKILNRYANHYLSFGANAGFLQKSFTPTNLRWDNQWTDTGFDLTNPTGEVSINEAVMLFDFGAGINYYYGNRSGSFKGYFGVAAFHLNQPNIEFLGNEEPLYTKYVVNGGFQFSGNTDVITFFPNFIYANQGPNQLFVFGSDMKFQLKGGARHTGFLKESSVAIGLYHRINDAVIPMIKLATGGFNIGISYDITLGNLTRVNNGTGGPEFSLIYKGGFGKGATSKKVNTKFM